MNKEQLVLDNSFEYSDNGFIWGNRIYKILEIDNKKLYHSHTVDEFKETGLEPSSFAKVQSYLQDYSTSCCITDALNARCRGCY